MDLAPGTAHAYLAAAYDRMLEVADRLGDDLVNQPPHGEGTNSVAALVVHCLGVTEFWLGHVGLGRPSERVRDDEFLATATVAELHDQVRVGVELAGADLQRIGAGEGQPGEMRGFLLGDDGDASLATHVLRELHQHLGHVELTADALLAG